MTAHCTCGRDWNSLIECHCANPGCHQHFSNVAAFDRHNPTRGGCPDPASLRDKDGNPLLRLVDRASGPTWIAWTSEEHREAMREHWAERRKANAGQTTRPSSAEQDGQVYPEPDAPENGIMPSGELSVP